MVTGRRWWVCPNSPPCPHAAVFHEIEEVGAPDVCTYDGCGCGRDLEQQWRWEGLR
jgi:hypothetical protein